MAEWVKGQSGNPGGRTKLGVKNTAELRLAAQAYSVEALQTVVRIMRNPKADFGHRLKAAEIVLSRGHGKPVQPVEHEVGRSLEQMVLDSQKLWDKEMGRVIEGEVVRELEGVTADLVELPAPEVGGRR